MKKKWKLLLSIAVAVVVLGGSLTAWLLYTPPDTDPDAPFRDLSDREKEKVLDAVTKFWEQHDRYLPVFWYGEPDPAQDPRLVEGGYRYGVRYYGTFGGYHIVLAPKRTATGNNMHLAGYGGGYEFSYIGLANIFGCKDGVAVHLHDLYDSGQLSKEQIGEIYQCYERYNQEVYIKEEWAKNEKDKKIIYAVLMCFTGVILVGTVIGGFCIYRKRRNKSLHLCVMCDLPVDAGVCQERSEEG